MQAEEASADATRLLKQKERLEALCRTLQQRASKQSTAPSVKHQGPDTAAEAPNCDDGDNASSEVKRPVHGEVEQGDLKSVLEEAAEGGSIAVEQAAAGFSMSEAAGSSQAIKGPAATYREAEACESIMIVPASSSLQCEEPLLQNTMYADDSLHMSDTAHSQIIAASLPQKLF